jgi:TRAP-type C4-dicarboxylate transport system permease small subunit
MWVEEISVMIMLWITWLGASLLWITRSHIVVDLLTSQFSKQVQRILVSLIDILTVIAAVTLLIVSIVTLRSLAGLELDSLAIDLSIKYYPVPIGAIGIGLAALLDLWRVCQSKETGS